MHRLRRGIIPFIVLSVTGVTVWLLAPRLIHSGDVSAIVAHVIDGDTIKAVLNDGETVTIRLLGIDAPEIDHGDTPSSCGGETAKAELSHLLPTGTLVTLTPDPASDDHDQYNRLLRYVSFDDLDIGKVMLESGWVGAWYPSSASAPTRWLAYVASEASARLGGTGSWSTCLTLGK